MCKTWSEPSDLGLGTGGATANPVQNTPKCTDRSIFLDLCAEYMLNFKCRRAEGPNNELFHVLQWCIAVWAAISVMQETDISFFDVSFFFLFPFISPVHTQVSKPLEYLLVVT